ncbi:MAG TPA: hypothetical protein VF077_10320 [Nitrospiraceae bacterium]
MAWTFSELQHHWDKRRTGKDRRTIADCGWNHRREYVEWNDYQKCFDLTLHSTVIVKVFPEKYRLNCGGWWTQITKKKIEQWSGAQLGAAPWRKRRSIVESEFYYPRGYGGVPYLFFNGLEIDYSGAVLNPQPFHRYKIKPGASREFTRVRRDVWQRIATRVMIGEFDEREDDLAKRSDDIPDGETIWQHMQEIAQCTPGVVIDPFLVRPLLVPRPRVIFGRSRHQNRYHSDEPRSGAQLLQSSFGAALRYYHQMNHSYEEIEVPIGEEA